MQTKLRSHLTFANVVACIALFVALGGTSVAAVSLKKNSVGSSQIKNSSLTGRDVKNSSLTTSDVKNKSLLAKDFKAGQLPKGSKGDPGATGPAGPAGVSGYEQVVSGDQSNLTGDTDTGTSPPCPTGKKVLGGGVLSSIVGTTIVRSYPQDDIQWTATVRNATGANSTFKVYAICATVR